MRSVVALIVSLMVLPLKAAANFSFDEKVAGFPQVQLAGTTADFGHAITKEKKYQMTNFDQVKVNRTQSEVCEILLDEFVGTLRNFVNETLFDDVEFVDKAHELKKTLKDISKTVDLITDPSSKLLNQLNFASHFFRAMTTSSAKLNIYKAIDVTEAIQISGHRPIYEIIELNIWALAMANSHGELDLQIKDYQKQLSNIRRKFRFWKEEFKLLSDPPSELLLEYNIQVNQVQNTLEILDSYIPV